MSFPRILAVVMSAIGVLIAGFQLLKSNEALKTLEEATSESRASSEVSGSTPPSESGSAHQAPSSHGEGSKETGEKHGASSSPGSSSSPLLFSLDEFYISVDSRHSFETHFLRLQIELELFSEDLRVFLEQRKSALRHAVIESTRRQDYSELQTLGGKLYLKEAIISNINGSLKKAAVKDAHFAAFNLQ